LAEPPFELGHAALEPANQCGGPFLRLARGIPGAPGLLPFAARGVQRPFGFGHVLAGLVELGFGLLALLLDTGQGTLRRRQPAAHVRKLPGRLPPGTAPVHKPIMPGGRTGADLGENP
jgi:hypothetical protein